MLIRDMIVYVTLAVYVLYLAKSMNLLGLQKGNKKAKKDVKREKERIKEEEKLVRRLKFYTRMSDLLGLTMNAKDESDFKYLLGRKGKMLKGLARKMTPKELHGKLKVIKYSSVLLALILFSFTLNPITLVPLLALFSTNIYKSSIMLQIEEENKELERDFPDLYNMMYPKLVQDTNVRIAPVLTDYLNTLEATKNSPGKESKEVIRDFVLDLRNNINVYADDSIAVAKLREKYTSVMVINFCNLATQSLKGVNNKDKLLSFKIELTNQQKERMETRANQLVRRGQIAVTACYIILFQFVALAMYAKFSEADGLSSIIG